MCAISLTIVRPDTTDTLQDSCLREIWLNIFRVQPDTARRQGQHDVKKGHIKAYVDCRMGPVWRNADCLLWRQNLLYDTLHCKMQSHFQVLIKLDYFICIPKGWFTAQRFGPLDHLEKQLTYLHVSTYKSQIILTFILADPNASTKV